MRISLILIVICSLSLSTVSLAEAFHYGNHCGTGEYQPNAPAIDTLDAICKAHDACCFCGKTYQMNEQTVFSSICAKECTEKFSTRINTFLSNNCTSIDTFASTRCVMARLGLIYMATLGSMTDEEQKKCNATYQYYTCKEKQNCIDFKACLSAVSWP